MEICTLSVRDHRLDQSQNALFIQPMRDCHDNKKDVQRSQLITCLFKKHRNEAQTNNTGCTVVTDVSGAGAWLKKRWRKCCVVHKPSNKSKKGVWKRSVMQQRGFYEVLTRWAQVLLFATNRASSPLPARWSCHTHSQMGGQGAEGSSTR